MRCQSSTQTMDHGSPVECVQIFPSGGICLSAGKRNVEATNVWKKYTSILQFAHILFKLECVKVTRR